MYSPWWREVHLGSHLFWHHSDTYIDIRKQVFTCTCTLWLIIYESSKRKSSVVISFLAESKFSFQIINFSMLENFDNFRIFYEISMSKSAECCNCPRKCTCVYNAWNNYHFRSNFQKLLPSVHDFWVISVEFLGSTKKQCLNIFHFYLIIQRSVWILHQWEDVHHWMSLLRHLSITMNFPFKSRQVSRNSYL